MRALKSYIGNPFFWYFFSWVIVIGLYKLDWTDMYPSLQPMLLTFILITALICFFFAYIYRERTVFIPLKSPNDYYHTVMKTTAILYLLVFAECVYSRSFPLLDYIMGVAELQSYQEFGIPILHVIVVNCLLLLFYFSSYCYLSSDKLINKYTIPVVLSLIAPLLFMSRGIALFMLFGFFIEFLISRERISKTILLSILSSSILILYLFGLSGNVRLNDSEGEVITDLGGATESFKESIIPTEFFWSYLYIVTPIGNLQNAIDSKAIYENDETGPKVLVANAILPQFIGKRLNIEMDDVEKYRVINELIVGTTYFEAYIIWGWPGMIIVFIVMMLYCVIMLRAVPVDSIFNVPLLCVLSTMTFFSLFDNMVIYMAIFPQLVLIFLLKNNLIAIDDNSDLQIEQYGKA